MSLPCENSRRKDEVPMTTSTPSTPGSNLIDRRKQSMGKVSDNPSCVHRRALGMNAPVSTAIRASSMWQRMCVRILYEEEKREGKKSRLVKRAVDKTSRARSHHSGPCKAQAEQVTVPSLPGALRHGQNGRAPKASLRRCGSRLERERASQSNTRPCLRPLQPTNNALDPLGGESEDGEKRTWSS